jgi:hypothetical protein
MEITAQAGKKEWFTVKEFATGVKSTPHAVNQWLFRHINFAEKYCKNISKNPKRKKWTIHESGVAAYISIKNTNSPKINALSERGFEVAKDNIAQLANQQIASQTTQDPILASLQAMVEMRQKQLTLDSKIETLEKRLEQTLSVATSPVPVTNGQRQFLNDRVKKYCMAHDLPFHIVWRQIHEHIGVAGVHNFEFKHYQAAIKYVEKMYIETGLVW